MFVCDRQSAVTLIFSSLILFINFSKNPSNQVVGCRSRIAPSPEQQKDERNKKAYP
jgi:hypothetical protein